MKHVKSNDIYECVRGLAADGGSAAILEIIERLNAYLAIENAFLVEKVLHLILTSEEQLRYVVREFLEYYNHERCHSGLDGASDRFAARAAGRRDPDVLPPRRPAQVLPARRARHARRRARECAAAVRARERVKKPLDAPRRRPVW